LRILKDEESLERVFESKPGEQKRGSILDRPASELREVRSSAHGSKAMGSALPKSQRLRVQVVCNPKPIMGIREFSEFLVAWHGLLYDLMPTLSCD
jgi:hypothetical protein